MMAILLNCVTLGMYQPCADETCTSNRCYILQLFDHLIFSFFTIEMIVKIVALGLIGKNTYLADTWNRLDIIIVAAGTLEYCLDVGSINLSAIRTIRVLRPLRAINRIPSMRILVMLLLDTLPMLGNVLLLCFFVFFIFGIIGVQLWAGLLRQRCFMEELPPGVKRPGPVSSYYQKQASQKDYLCSMEKDNGMHKCEKLPHYQHHEVICYGLALPHTNNTLPDSFCVDWNQYYKVCHAGDKNPFQGAISFDNIGLAWVAIFLVISLEGWTDIMYYVQDAHSFWDWIYFMLLIVVGSFFMINLCLVVIATQFSETKKREMKRMKQERAHFQSTSSLANTNPSEQPLSCYKEMMRYLAHLGRRARRRFLHWYKQMHQEPGKEELPHSESLQSKHHGLPHQLEQSLLKCQESCYDFSNNNNFDSRNSSSIQFIHISQTPEHNVIWPLFESSVAPYASPESSEIDPTSSPRRPNLLNVLTPDNSIVPITVFTPDSSSISECQVSENNMTLKRMHEYIETSFSDIRPLTPEELTLAVEVCNLILSVIFGLEMMLKIVADGLFGYISNGFNVLDGVIVILSIVELWQSSGSGLSVLRTFRLLRILKLVRFMPALQRQLVIMLQTLDNVAVFFALLILFIFIFSILGMNLFGCKFCEKDEDGVMQCDRKNFDSLLWALVTVFQILTQEDWNVVLFNGMEKTSHWAALYFVALMTFGNYVLFNLLVAILVEGFSTVDDKKKSNEKLSNCNETEYKEDDVSDDENLKSSSKIENVIYKQDDVSDDESSKSPSKIENFIHYADPKDNIEKETMMLSKPLVIKTDSKPGELLCFPPIITHTAATPQGSPNATLEPLVRDLNNKYTPFMALNISNTSIDSIDKSPTPSLVGTPQNSPSLSRTYSKNSKTLIVPTSEISGHFSDSNQRGCHSPSSSSRRNSLTPSLITKNLSRKESQNSNAGSLKLRRRGSMCSWRGWQKRKRERENSDSASVTDGEEVLLNNKTIIHHNNPTADHTLCNGGFPALSNTPNNKRPLASKQNSINSHKSLTPQNSINSHSFQSSSGIDLETFKNHVPCSRQTSVNASAVTHNSLTPQQSLNTYSYISSRHNSLTGSLLKDDFKLNNLAEVASVRIENGNYPIDKHLNGKLCWLVEPGGCLEEHKDYSLLIFSPRNRFRQICSKIVENRRFDYGILFFITLNCITLAMERPNIPPDSLEREILTTANYIFTVVFSLEMTAKVISKGLWYGEHAYLKSGWNVMDGILVSISLLDFILSVVAHGSSRIFAILRVFRLLRSLRPLRVINRAPGLKLVVQTLLSSLRPIGNIVLICCTFFIIFGILGVQLFKGKLYYCNGPRVTNVKNKTECLAADPRNEWVNRKYNFDNLGQALMALFVLSSKDGWVNIMYTGLDAVDIDQQPIENYNEWRLLYFISFLLLVAFFVLNMFVGVVVENFHRCREEQEKEEKARRAVKRACKLEKKRRKMREPPYYINFSKPRLFTHNIITSKYFDLAIAAVIGLNVVTMAMEFYMMPVELVYALKIFNYFFTAVFILEAVMKIAAFGVRRYLMDKWNQLDVLIVILSIVGICLEEMESKIIPINPTIIRVMRVLRIARVLKLLKMANGIRALLDTVMQALPQVGNLGLLFFLLFFIFAALGVELFGRLECNDDFPCQGLGEHAHFHNFGMAFLTLFRVATGDNWNGIMKDTLRDHCDMSSDCLTNCCVTPLVAPLYFVIFVLMAQFVLVNVVVAVLMKHLEESHKQMDEDIEMDKEIEQELAAEVREAQEMELEEILEQESSKEQPQAKDVMVTSPQRLLAKASSVPINFTFTFPHPC
ncbi:voltage-dependent T-type calcium channel subunit alpha-1G-like [Limulus polyphemus]|uniref:Voltage-dependent T-type calcium channel subunit alpha n=1 Tax=Limulus polyphemus TaxID=6850 RepID=A0ABM1TK68_LIMPO|nr:voltage-dependent T-type calcium channel subunit alpha-1G-like [Limulus polyphemus]